MVDFNFILRLGSGSWNRILTQAHDLSEPVIPPDSCPPTVMVNTDLPWPPWSVGEVLMTGLIPSDLVGALSARFRVMRELHDALPISVLSPNGFWEPRLDPLMYFRGSGLHPFEESQNTVYAWAYLSLQISLK